MKFVILFVGICLVQVHGAAYRKLQLPWHLESEYPNHPYFHLGLRSRSLDSNEFIEDANNQLAGKLTEAEKQTREKTDEAILTYLSKGKIMEDTGREKLEDIILKIQTELEALEQAGENEKECVDKHKERQNEIENTSRTTLEACPANFNEQSENIKEELEISYNTTGEYIAELLALYKTCLEEHDNDKDIIDCNFHKSLEFAEETHGALDTAAALADERIPFIVKEEYSCLLGSAYDSQLEFMALKRDVHSCISDKKKI